MWLVRDCNVMIDDCFVLCVCVQTVDVNKLDVYVYQLHDSHEEMEQLDNDDEVIAASHWLLPCTHFDGLWESLIYDGNVKNNVVTSSVLAFTVIIHVVIISNSVIIVERFSDG